MTEIEVKQLIKRLEADDERLRIIGYAAIFDAPDNGGDVVRKGAFACAAKAVLPLLWEHDQHRRIGFVESLSEDARGLRVIAQLDDDSAFVHEGMGLSFGYRVREKKHVGGHRELMDVELIEVSVVKNPMQPKAQINCIIGIRAQEASHDGR
jgi:HK97 family phage prohead protease